jgi:hypothetical protein
VPNLTRASEDIKPGSAEYPRLTKFSAESNAYVATLVATFPTGGRLDTSPEVTGAKSRLGDAGRLIVVLK